MRSEVLVELLTYADSFAAHDEGLHLAPENWNHMRELIYALSPARVAEGMVETLQARVAQWMQSCFGPRISSDKTERNHRFLEEALELVQANGCTKSEAHQLVDYVFGRSVGDPHQECGGVLITLAALCSASGLDMEKAGEDELARIWQKIELIRAKQAAKPPHSPLPSAPESPAKEQPWEQYTKADMEAACAVVLAGFRSKPMLDKMVDRFLAWPLPPTVCSDACVVQRGYPHRIGTNLLTADEARQMLEYVLTPPPPERP